MLSLPYQASPWKSLGEFSHAIKRGSVTSPYAGDTPGVDGGASQYLRPCHGDGHTPGPVIMGILHTWEAFEYGRSMSLMRHDGIEV